MDSPEWRMRILKMNLIDNYLEELQLYENVKCKYFMFNLKQAKKDYDGMMKQHKANCKKDWDPFKRAKAYQHCIKQIPSYAKSKLKMAERMAQKVKQHCSNKVSEAEGMQGLPKGWKHSSVKKFAKTNGIPVPVAYVTIFTELAAAFSLSLGILPQLGALAVMGLMAGTMTMHIFRWHSPYWATKGGWEYDLIIFSVCAVIFTVGGGAIGLLPSL